MPEEERSDEMDEVLGRVPSWPVRWGSMVILLLVGFLFCFAWLVKSPELIEGEAVVIGTEAPVFLRPERKEIIGKILKEGGEKVSAGEKILSLGDPKEKRQIQRRIEAVKKLQRSVKNGMDVAKLPTIKGKDLKGLQEAYERVKRSRLRYKRAKRSERQKEASGQISDRIDLAQKALRSEKKRGRLLKNEWKRSQEAFQTQKKLYQRGAISRKEFRSAKKELLQQEQQVQRAKRNRLQTRSRLSELREQRKRRLIEGREEKEKAREELLLDARSFRKTAEARKAELTLRAPLAGTLSEPKALKRGQSVEAGEKLLAIIPESHQYRAKAFIPEKKLAKIEKGGEVLLELKGYPRKEYGYLKGQVLRRSHLPSEEKYRVEIALSNGLLTDHGKRIEVKGRISARAFLKAEEQNLLQRILSR